MQKEPASTNPLSPVMATRRTKTKSGSSLPNAKQTPLDEPAAPRHRVSSRPVPSVVKDTRGTYGERYPDEEDTGTGSHTMVLPTATIEERMEVLKANDQERREKQHMKALAEQGVARRPNTLIRTRYGPLKAVTYNGSGGSVKVIAGLPPDPGATNKTAAAKAEEVRTFGEGRSKEWGAMEIEKD